MFVQDILPRALPFAVYIAFIAIADLLAWFGWQELRWLYPVKCGIVALFLALCWRRYVELARWDLQARELLLALTVGILVLILWINLDVDWMVLGSSPGFDPSDGKHIDWIWVAVRIAGATLVVPLMEELFWRSFLMRWITNVDFQRLPAANVGIKAFLVTIVLFGIEHNQWLAGVVAGVAYAWLYMRIGSLWAAIVAHATTNALLGAWIVFTGKWTYW